VKISGAQFAGHGYTFRRARRGLWGAAAGGVWLAGAVEE
jgi:hypothetical protein